MQSNAKQCKAMQSKAIQSNPSSDKKKPLIGVALGYFFFVFVFCFFVLFFFFFCFFSFFGSCPRALSTKRGPRPPKILKIEKFLQIRFFYNLKMFPCAPKILK